MKGAKLAPNLSLMFLEHGSLADRYAKATKAGFKAVECVNPFETSIEELKKAKEHAQVEQVLINAFAGNNDEKGFAAVPGKEKEFHDSLRTSILYAKALKCPRIHIMSGKRQEDVSLASMKDTYVKNLREAAEILEKENIIGLIEPVNEYTVFNYFMNDFNLAENVVKTINSPYLRLQLDIFHLQIITGNLTRNIQRLLPLTGHIQVSQAPKRDELNAPGEINYPYVFNLLDQFGYEGFIGLEYKPSDNATEKSLNWIQEFGLSL